MDPLEEMLEIEKKGLGNWSDQNTEAMHSFVHKEMIKGNYFVNDVTCAKAAEQQHKLVLKINGYSLNKH